MSMLFCANMDVFCAPNHGSRLLRWTVPTAPYQHAWELRSGNQPFAARLLPDLKIHLIFDLSGQFATEPLFLWLADHHLELTLPANLHWVALAFPGWEASGLQQSALDLETFKHPAPQVALDGWTEMLYFALLEDKNRNAPIDRALPWFHDAMLEHLSDRPDPLARHLSARQRRRLTQSHLALRPNVIERIERFRRALETLHEPEPDLSGFADQAHFIRECRRFSSLTPKQLQSLERW
jgi:AraC-like DNA-binding protein